MAVRIDFKNVVQTQLADVRAAIAAASGAANPELAQEELRLASLEALILTRGNVIYSGQKDPKVQTLDMIEKFYAVTGDMSAYPAATINPRAEVTAELARMRGLPRTSALKKEIKVFEKLEKKVASMGDTAGSGVAVLAIEHLDPVKKQVILEE